MKKIQQFLFPFTIKNIFQFSILLFCIGFSLGTTMLIYPIHWISDYVKANSWSLGSENVLIKTCISIYIIVSFVFSVILLRRLLKVKKNASKIIFFAILIVTTSYFLWLWFNPDLMGKSNKDKIGSETTKNTEFFFGAYPSESKLYDLKDEGYTVVISLLHPAVIPFEPKLISDEEKHVKTVGIKYIHIPMLPWISDNLDAIAKIKEVIKNKKGKIYIHCYLGKDRVNVVKNIIKNNNGSIDKSTEPESKRKLDNITKFERGEIFKLEPDVFLIPYPTDEEYFGYILTSPIKNVISLLNPLDKGDAELIEKEKKLLPQYDIIYHLMPLVINNYYPDTVVNIVNRIKKLPHPLVIHAFFTKGVIGEAIKLTYSSGKAALPPTLFNEPMKNGKPVIISSNGIAGFTPTRAEIKSYLYFKGIRNIAYLGNSNSTKALKKQAEKCGIEWKVYNLNDTKLIDAIKTNGTWYIFGEPINKIQNAFPSKF